MTRTHNHSHNSIRRGKKNKTYVGRRKKTEDKLHPCMYGCQMVRPLDDTMNKEGQGHMSRGCRKKDKPHLGFEPAPSYEYNHATTEPYQTV